MKKFILTLILSLSFGFQALAQTLQASVNRNPVPEGEAFILTLKLENGQDNSLSPDLKPLEKDFSVYSVSNSSQINIINGVRSDTRQWDIGLIANKTGEVSIPAIKLGTLSSQPIVMKIIGAEAAAAGEQNNSAKAGTQPRYSMKAEINNKNPYVQQQVDYTVTILDTGGLQGDAPYFSDNGGNDWIIKTAAAPTVDSKTINGKTIREIKFHYALFPQKSGVLKAPQAHFKGFYLTQDRVAYDPFEDLFGNSLAASGFGFADMFATQNPVNLVSKPLEVNVRTIPKANNGSWWLPAEKVELYSEWSPKNPQFKVGEAVSRTIYLKAAGVVENQLPDIKFPKIGGMKQYPEKPLAESRLNNDKIISIKKAVNVYIPSQAGEITLPEIRVPWFNVGSNQMEYASLPAMTIKVSPADTTAAATTTEQLAPVSDTAEREQQMTEAADDAVDVFAAETQPNSRLYFMVAVAFLLGILFSYLLLKSHLSPAPKNKEKIRDFKRHIEQKAREKDFRGLRDGLFEWCDSIHPEQKTVNLKEVIRLNPQPDFEKAVNRLMEELYSDNGKNWDAEEFIAAFNKVYEQQKRSKHKHKKPLPELYTQ